jgi:hypothetical protein
MDISGRLARALADKAPPPDLPPAEAARAARLRYVADSAPGITRRRSGKGFLPLHRRSGERRSIDSGDVNDHLREISGVDERDAPVEAPARVPALGPDTRSRRHRALDTRLAVLMLRRQRFLLFHHESLRRGEAAALSKQEATRRRS